MDGDQNYGHPIYTQLRDSNMNRAAGGGFAGGDKRGTDTTYGNQGMSSK